MNSDERAFSRIREKAIVAVKQRFHLGIIAHTNTNMLAGPGKLSDRAAAYGALGNELIHGFLENVIDMSPKTIADQALCRRFADITQADIANIFIAHGSLRSS